jgi:hypothetical protein
MKNFKLSFTDNTTYAGKDLEGFYAEALLKGVSKESFKLIPNVKSKAKIAQLNLGSILQDADCSFNGTGEGTLAQKEVEAHDVKINLEYCSRTFETNYLSELMRAGSNSDQVMPESVEQFLLDEVAKKTSNDLEYIVWQGSGATVATNFVSEIGLEAKLAADGDVIDVSGTTLGAGNIIAEMNKVYDAIPAELRDKEDLAIYVGTAAGSYYRQALANASAETYYMQKHDELEFLGVKIIVAGGMSANKMVAAQQSNLLLITDLMSDFGEVLVLPQRSVTGAPVVRFVGDFKFGTDFVYGSEIVLYA